MAKSLTLAQLKQRSDAGKIGGRIGGKKGGQAVPASASPYSAVS